MNQTVTEISHPEIDKIFTEISIAHMQGVFPEYGNLNADYRVVAGYVMPYGKAVAHTFAKDKLIRLGTQHYHSVINWKGRDVVIKDVKKVDGLLRHEIAHYIQREWGKSHSDKGSTHLSLSWFWVVSQWAIRHLGANPEFWNEENLLRIYNKLRNEKNLKAEKNDFADFFSSFEFNESHMGMEMFENEYFEITPKQHGNTGKKRVKMERVCQHCQKPFLGSPRATFCSASHKVMFHRARVKNEG